jgi:hypothetical protein
MPIIPPFKRLRREVLKFKTTMGNTVKPYIERRKQTKTKITSFR